MFIGVGAESTRGHGKFATAKAGQKRGPDFIDGRRGRRRRRRRRGGRLRSRGVVRPVLRKYHF